MYSLFLRGLDLSCLELMSLTYILILKLELVMSLCLDLRRLIFLATIFVNFYFYFFVSCMLVQGKLGTTEKIPGKSPRFPTEHSMVVDTLFRLYHQF